MARNATIPFIPTILTLAEGRRRSRRAERPQAMRGRLRVSATKIRGSMACFSAAIRRSWGSPAPTDAGVPVVYKLNMKEPVGSRGTAVVMRDNDVLYVSDCRFSRPAKAPRVFTGSIGSANAAQVSNETGTVGRFPPSHSAVIGLGYVGLPLSQALTGQASCLGL